MKSLGCFCPGVTGHGKPFFKIAFSFKRECVGASAADTSESEKAHCESVSGSRDFCRQFRESAVLVVDKERFMGRESFKTFLRVTVAR